MEQLKNAGMAILDLIKLKVCNMRRYLSYIVILVFVLIIAVGCGKEKVARNHFPIIKANIYTLQIAVKEKNIAQIDSLLSVKILDKNQSSDSLLRFVYGDANNFKFVQFGNAEIVHTNDKARVDCYIMDSTSSHDRPFVLFLSYENDLWLFSSFKEKSATDSLKLD